MRPTGGFTVEPESDPVLARGEHHDAPDELLRDRALLRERVALADALAQLFKPRSHDATGSNLALAIRQFLPMFRQASFDDGPEFPQECCLAAMAV